MAIVNNKLVEDSSIFRNADRWREKDDAQRKTSRQRINMLGLLIAIASLFPALFFNFLNNFPFRGDDSEYARASVELFRTLIRSPIEWPGQLLAIFLSKPNALIWIGEFFVPVGHLMESIDNGLLFSV